MDADDMENHSADIPKVGRTSFSTETSGDSSLVPMAKPNDDRYFLTDRPIALEPCHLVAQDIDDRTVRIQS